MALCAQPRTFVLALLFIVLAGCEDNHYDVELTPDGDGLRRQLQVRRMDGNDEKPFPKEELQAIAKVYGVPTPEKNINIPPFAARFVDRMPQDVGGAGWYLTLPSPLGTTSGYVERFRGTIDLVARVEEQNADIDQGLDHLIAWLKTEIGAEPYATKAVAALDKQLRHDMKNLVLYSLSGTMPVDDKHASQNMFVRVGAFLAERGYCQPKELPALLRAIDDAQHGDGARLAEFAIRWLAAGAGIAPDQPLPERLKRLTNPAVLLASLQKYGEATPEYQQRLARWETEKKTNPAAARPDGLGVFVDFDPLGLGGGTNQLNMRLHAKAEPHDTNGTWSAEKKTVSWSQPIPDANLKQQWPVLCYAFWSEPDTKYQQARFGRVMLKDKKMAEYCAWYAGLTADERREWDALIASEPVGDALVNRIEQFRFRQDPPYVPPRELPKDEKDKMEPPPSLADEPRRLFESALVQEKQEREQKEKAKLG